MRREQLKPSKPVKQVPQVQEVTFSEPDPLTEEACYEIIEEAVARGIPRETVVEKLKELSGFELKQPNRS